MTPPPPPPHTKTDRELEESISAAQGRWEQRRVDQAIAIGPWEEIDRLRNQVDRLRGQLREMMQLVFDLRASAAVEKPARKPCKSSDRTVEKRRNASA